VPAVVPHSRWGAGCVPLPALGAPPLGTDSKDVGEIDLRGASEAKPRHSPWRTGFTAGGRQPLKVPFEIRVVDLSEIAAIDRINADLDLRATLDSAKSMMS
jgi:hypothetical protein